MKTTKNPIDAVRLDFLIECADAMVVKSLEMRLGCMSGDVDAADGAFECMKIIGRDIAATRREIETIDEDKAMEALS